MKNLVMDKHSSLLRKLLNYGPKRFSTFAPGPNTIKSFLPVIYKFLLSERMSVRLKLAMDKHSSLLQKIINYRQKSFIKLATGPKAINTFIVCKVQFSYKARAFVRVD
jgi:hypothetical protein